MRLALSIVLTLLIASHIASHAMAQNAQNQTPQIEAPKVQAAPIKDAQLASMHILDDAPAAPEAATPAQPFMLQPAPAPQPTFEHKVIDKKFIVVMSSLAVAESLRFTTRKLVIDREFAAGAPWITTVPSTSHMVARDAAFFASEVLVAYAIKKRHDWLPGDRYIQKLWWVYPAAMTTLHIKNAVGNIRTKGPGGCTSIECAEEMELESQ